MFHSLGVKMPPTEDVQGAAQVNPPIARGLVNAM